MSISTNFSNETWEVSENQLKKSTEKIAEYSFEQEALQREELNSILLSLVG